VASLSQGRTAAAQCGLFTHKSVPVIFEPPCTLIYTARENSSSFVALSNGPQKDISIFLPEETEQ